MENDSTNNDDESLGAMMFQAFALSAASVVGTMATVLVIGVAVDKYAKWKKDKREISEE